MRETFISILTILAVVSRPVLGTDKDGFNFYKDYLRGRTDEIMPELADPGERIYFYRTPLQLYPGILQAVEQEYRKRTGNAFKNHMLNKESWEKDNTPDKRSSKTALSFLIQGKHLPYHTDVGYYCPYGK